MASLLIAVIYLAFISLGLPDSLLGSAWPTMQTAFHVPSSYAGYVSMMISLMTIISALVSPKLIKRIHTKWIVIISISLTVVGLLGFSCTAQYWTLFLFAIPYGLGAIISPNLMALALKYARWNEGYRWTAYIQIAILAVCILSLPLWKNAEQEASEAEDTAGIKETIKVPGVILTLLAFFSYCAGEATCFLWTSSYFAGTKQGISGELVAAFGSLIFGGLMLGRLISGFISNRFGDRFLIRMGIAVEFLGILFIILPSEGYLLAAIGFLIVGTGMGPIYPAIQHMAPANFGKKYSAAVIGLQMASAYLGSTFMPTVFGRLQQIIGIWIMPLYLTLFAFMNVAFLEWAYHKIDREGNHA